MTVMLVLKTIVIVKEKDVIIPLLNAMMEVYVLKIPALLLMVANTILSPAMTDLLAPLIIVNVK
jgi:hypothetical protein